MARAADTATPLFDPETGYRLRNYQAPTPQTVPPSTRVWLDDIDRLVRDERAILLDVSPAAGARPDPTTGEWNLSKPHSNLPGSAWLANVGQGVLDAAAEEYLSRGLAALTNRDKSRAIVVYCRADCWMAVNAIKRLERLGYTRLFWFSEGTDGARDFDRPLAPATPLPMPPAR